MGRWRRWEAGIMGRRGTDEERGSRNAITSSRFFNGVDQSKSSVQKHTVTTTTTTTRQFGRVKQLKKKQVRLPCHHKLQLPNEFLHVYCFIELLCLKCRRSTIHAGLSFNVRFEMKIMRRALRRHKPFDQSLTESQ